MKHSYSNNDTCFSIEVIDEILEEDFDALLYEGSKILYCIEGTILEEKFFAEFDEFIEMTAEENSESESDTEEPPFEKSLLTPITRSKHLLKNLLRILNLNLFLITWIMYSWKNPLFFLLSYHLRFLKKTKTKFDIEIKDRKGTENVTADHLSRIENDETSDASEVDDNFPRETLMEMNTEDEPWFADFANYLVSNIIPKGMTYQ
ncbi:hypothetical protein Tco_1006576 [Tanacetum coccineum]|uniref:Reverse transcriptase domain-containing protein n=1 Tax=Tanacetum coccineum TaxID=301880 RepID=A0ABQ5FIB0_9ASTR